MNDKEKYKPWAQTNVLWTPEATKLLDEVWQSAWRKLFEQSNANADKRTTRFVEPEDIYEVAENVFADILTELDERRKDLK